MPFRIIVLKGLNFEENEKKRKITLFIEKSTYQNITLHFNQVSYLQTMIYMRTYLADNFFKKYMIVEKLGRGRYSSVFKVIKMENGSNYALKICSKDNLSKEELRVLYNEAKIMEVLRHKNIVKFYEATDNQETF